MTIPDPASIEIKLYFLDPMGLLDEDEDEGDVVLIVPENGVGEEDLNWVRLIVRAVGDGRFQTLEPTSLTPFGPWAPRLPLGTVFDAEQRSDGGYLLRRIVEEPRTWLRIVNGVERSVLEDAAVEPLLRQLVDRGDNWELFGQYLSLEGSLPEGQEEPREEVQRILDQLLPLLARSMGDSDASAGAEE